MAFDGPIPDSAPEDGRAGAEPRPGNGELDPYNEQGWEGRFVCAFLADGRKPDDGPRFLDNGEHLSIFDEDGRLLWAGVLDFTSPGWFARRRWNGTMWADNHPRGVPYEQWMAWFTHRPALRAQLDP